MVKRSKTVWICVVYILTFDVKVSKRNILCALFLQLHSKYEGKKQQANWTR